MNDAMAVYKPDWKEARERMLAWWAGKKTDRVPAYIAARKIHPPPKNPAQPKPMTTFPAQWIDPETIFYNLDRRLESTFWGGEAFPMHFVTQGPMFCCTYFGCEPFTQPGRTWYRKPDNLTWDQADTIQFDPQNRWWQLTRTIHRQSAQRAQGRYLTTVRGICGIFDIFMELFGVEETLIAMSERPDHVRALRDKMIPWCRQTYDDIQGLIQPYQEGSIDGMMTWGPGRVWYVHCDMSVMISPEMFRDFVLDELRALLQHVDHGIYHLDGHDQIRHLDALLSIEALEMVQYAPVAKPGDANYRDPLLWIDLFKTIQAAGKKLWIICPPARIRELFSRISREGVFLFVECPDELAARQTLRDLDQIGM